MLFLFFIVCSQFVSLYSSEFQTKKNEAHKKYEQSARSQDDDDDDDCVVPSEPEEAENFSEHLSFFNRMSRLFRTGPAQAAESGALEGASDLEQKEEAQSQLKKPKPAEAEARCLAAQGQQKKDQKNLEEPQRHSSVDLGDWAAAPAVSNTEGKANPSLSSCGLAKSGDCPDKVVIGKKNGLFARYIDKEDELFWAMSIYGDEQKKQEFIAEYQASFKSLAWKEIGFFTTEQFFEKSPRQAISFIFDPETNHLFSEELKKELEPIDKLLKSDDVSDAKIKKALVDFMAWKEAKVSELSFDGLRGEHDTAVARNKNKLFMRCINKQDQPYWRVFLYNDEQKTQEFMAKYQVLHGSSDFRQIEFFTAEQFYKKHMELVALLLLDRRTKPLLSEELKQTVEPVVALLRADRLSDEEVGKILPSLIAGLELKVSALPLDGSEWVATGTLGQDASKSVAQQQEDQRNVAAALLEKNKKLEAQRLEHKKAEECKIADEFSLQENKERMRDQFFKFKNELLDLQKRATKDMKTILSGLVSEITKKKQEFDACKGNAFKKQSKTFEEFLAGFRIKMDQAIKDFELVVTNPKKLKSLVQAQDDGDDARLSQPQQKQPGSLQELCEKKEPSVDLSDGAAAPAEAGAPKSASDLEQKETQARAVIKQAVWAEFLAMTMEQERAIGMIRVEDEIAKHKALVEKNQFLKKERALSRDAAEKSIKQIAEEVQGQAENPKPAEAAMDSNRKALEAEAQSLAAQGKYNKEDLDRLVNLLSEGGKPLQDGIEKKYLKLQRKQKKDQENFEEPQRHSSVDLSDGSAAPAQAGPVTPDLFAKGVASLAVAAVAQKNIDKDSEKQVLGLAVDEIKKDSSDVNSKPKLCGFGRFKPSTLLHYKSWDDKS